ncbi:MAG: hypothetical protein U0228_32380 [Myxococcaceae bacterium]
MVVSRLPFAPRLVASLLALWGSGALAKPWQGITPGGSSGIDVVGKFGEPSKKIDAKGLEVLIYTGEKAIKGTVQAQFKCDPTTKEVQRIDVYPAPVLDVAAIEKGYGPGCETNKAAEPCYWKKETPQKRPYFLYAKLGLAVFFKEDNTVQSFTFLPPAADK